MLSGVFVITPEKFDDERGFFARSWDKKIFEEKNLNSNIVQCSISYNKYRGTLRGLHYQKSPYGEVKTVRCTHGKIYDVILDLRKDSKTFKKWISVELSSDEYKMVYIPEDCAHGFQTLEDNTEVFYQISQYHKPEFYVGVRWNDPTFQISWPLAISKISEKDSSLKDYE